MKKLSKIFSIVIMISIVLSSINIVYADSLQNDNYNTEIKQLMAIGIVDNDILEETPITRGEFAYYLVKFLGLNPESLEGITQVFYDVPVTHKYFSSISYCAKQGYMVGYGNGFFEPDDMLIAEDVLKPVIVALGYDYLAKSYGGGYTGYISTANEIGLLKGITLPSGEGLFYEEALKIIYNALEIPLIRATGVNQDEYIYEKDNSKNVLSEYHKMRRLKGVVTATDVTGVHGYTATYDNTFIVNGYTIKTDDSVVRMYIGQKVDLIYSFDEDGNKDLVICLLDKQSEKITVSYEDFISLNSGIFSYKGENDKIISLKVAMNFDFIYNGKTERYNASKLTNSTYGYFELISSDCSSNYDIVKFTDYKTLAVARVVPASGIIYGLSDYDTLLSFDLETDKIILLDEDNNIVDINSLTADDVLTYCKNGNYIFGYVTRKVASGVVNELNISEQIIVADGVEFKVSRDKASLYSYAKINDSVLLYLDAFGNVSGMTVSAQSDGSKFYLPIKLYKNDHPTGNVVGLKCFDISEHAIKQIELCEKINLNGTPGVDVESDYTNINNALTFISYAPIMLKINSDGKITRIDTSKDASSYSQDEDGLTVLANGEELYYRANVNSFEAKAYTDSSTKIIIIPSDMNGVEAEDFKVLSTIASNTYIVSAFSTSKNKPNASVVTMRNSDYASMPSRPGTGIITKITDVIDEDGAECKKVYYKTSTETVSFIMDNPELQDVFNPSATTYGYYRPPIKAKELVVGDIISVVVSDKNTLENFNCYWKSNTEVLKSKEQIYRANNRMVICKVEKVGGEYIVYNAKIRTSDTDATENHYERREFLPISGLVVQMIEKNGSQVKIMDSDVSEILEGDIIIYNSEAYVPKKVFILRGLTKTFDELNNEEPIV